MLYMVRFKWLILWYKHLYIRNILPNPLHKMNVGILVTVSIQSNDFVSARTVRRHVLHAHSLTHSVVTSRGVPCIQHLAFHPTRSWHIDSSFSMALMSRRCMCMSLLNRSCWIVVIRVIGGLPGFLFTGLNASLKYCLAGVSGFKRTRCPSHDSRRRLVTTLQGSHFGFGSQCQMLLTCLVEGCKCCSR